MSHTILLFNDSHVRFDEYDLIVASLLILDTNQEAIDLYFPTMKDVWLENFATSGNGCADLYLEDFLTEVELENKLLKIVEKTYEHVKLNTHNNIFDLSVIDNLISIVKIGVARQYPSNRILVALNGLKTLLD